MLKCKSLLSFIPIFVSWLNLAQGSLLYINSWEIIQFTQRTVLIYFMWARFCLKKIIILIENILIAMFI